jgi:hypothetical protein
MQWHTPRYGAAGVKGRALPSLLRNLLYDGLER